MRINCIEVSCDADLNVTFRLTLPVKAEHTHLLDSTKIVSYIRKDRIRYNFVFESADRQAVIRVMTAAQLVISEQKIKEMQARHTRLHEKLSEIN